MLHPNQFNVNDAWIIFRLTEEPADLVDTGPMDVFALMDAGSCFILSNVFSSAANAALSRPDCREFLDKAFAHKRKLPRTIFIPRKEGSPQFSDHYVRQGNASH